MPRPNRFQKDAPVPLRKNTGSPTFTDEQMMMFASLFSALLIGGHGIYAKGNAEGNSIRVKIYTDDDTYQDTVHNQEDVQYLLRDYAEQMKVLPHFEALMGKLHAATAPAAPGAPKRLREG